MVAVKEDFDTSVEAQNQFEVEATTTVEASQARATLEAGIRNIAQIRAVTTAAAESYGTIIEASHWSIVSQDAFKKRK